MAISIKMNKTTRVRFAPSPTGDLHIGGARTALFNWLFARKTRGVFLLRIEDTDETRATEESVGGIIESLKWLGLDWDEGVHDPCTAQVPRGEYGPYHQMQRLVIYKKWTDKLLSSGNAYYCFCTHEELEQMRKTQLLNKQPPKYDGRCRGLPDAEIKEKLAGGRKAVVRFKMPDSGATVFTDLIRGEVKFENGLLDDFIIVKTSGVPTYNFACVVDDYEMKITHVLRGDDHLSNTPRQIQLYNALGWAGDVPEFGHLSMILGQDGSRLSKRHGAGSVLEYRQAGYLPEALFNYMALLGWSTADSQQLFSSREELVEKFSIERCSKSPAIFDLQKLLWMNGEYIRKMPVEKLIELSPLAGRIDFSNQKEYNYIRSAVKLEHEKIKLLTDIPYLVEFFIKEEIDYDPAAVEKVLKKENVGGLLQDIRERFEKSAEFSAAATEKICRDYAEEKGLKTSKVFHPLRVAVSGRTQGPGLFEMIELLGMKRVLTRLKRTVEKYV